MSCPFPGMDPYLEGELWTTFHIQLAVEIARQLTPRLLPRYLAFANQRQVTDTPEEVSIEATDVYPDVGVVEARQAPLPIGGAALAEAPIKLTTVVPSRVPHSWVEIRDRSGRELVTLIEILSPTNQRSDGRKEYLEKRKKILLSTAHLLEIDLLRKGKRVPMTKPLPAADYFVFLTRANRRPETEVWPVPLFDRLPTVRVPLREPDPDVPLDLQQAFSTIYELSPYAVAIDYSKPPDVPLSTAAAAWAAERIRAIQG
ncbi:MAG TPA: DUF4058 family protein [Pirellulales bacterium]|nr:DUF4058 family protein [Pirellulales bacterium]